MAERSWWHGQLLGIDLETTGVRRHGDVPVSFALVRVAAGRVVERRLALVDPERPIPPAATAVHGITTERARRDGLPLRAAVELLAEELLEAADRGVPVVGMNLAYDLSLVDHQLRACTGTGLAEAGWRGPALDVLVLDRHLDRRRPGGRRLVHLCEHYGVALTAAHEAGADAEAAVLVLLALCDRFPVLTATGLAELTEQQAAWHRAWVERAAAARALDGGAPPAADEGDWPLARPAVPAPVAPVLPPDRAAVAAPAV
ncbi:MAG: exonuclease domain-containing protein [Actinomycetota bacterium]|nr:exonuclease domain-containing protein [Actinomycetota bacterium]